MTPNQWTILEALQFGPRWIRSFQTVKPLLNDLIACGLVERCRPHLGWANNMVRLTKGGLDRLGINEARPKAEPIATARPPAQLGTLRPDASPKVRGDCEAFLSAVAAGKEPNEIVGQLAERHGLQRPAIWRRLRSGGVLAPYKVRPSEHPRKPHRWRAGLQMNDGHEPTPVGPPVYRDPCPRCGVRGDIGCPHSARSLTIGAWL